MENCVKKYMVEFIAGSCIVGCYYQLVRVYDDAILCAYRTIEEVVAYCNEFGIDMNNVAEC